MELTPYLNYFWQTDLIRLRPLRPEDAEKKQREWTDTEARRLLESQLDLPPVSIETQYRITYSRKDQGVRQASVAPSAGVAFEPAWQSGYGT